MNIKEIWQCKKGLRSFLIAAGLLLIAGPVVQADDFEFTLDADFLSGDLSGVDLSVADQLQLSQSGAIFPLMWIANAGEDTMSKVDTDSNVEAARYRTWLGSGTLPRKNPWSGHAPSRTAVDVDGNVYVANRTFMQRQVSVIKILSEGGIDRNGNGVIDTSTDANGDGQIQLSEMMPVIDDNGNGQFDCDATDCESRDERIAWVAYFGQNNGVGRSLCLGTDGNVWVSNSTYRNYYKLSAADGSVMAGPFYVSGYPYGCAVDGDGNLWGANLSSYLTQMDTTPGSEGQISYRNSGRGFYAITLGKDDNGNTRVYGGGMGGQSYMQFDTSTETFSEPAVERIGSLGVAVKGDGKIVVGNSGQMKIFNVDGSLFCTGASQGGGDVRGSVVDSNGDIWAVFLSQNKVAKWSGDDCSPLGVVPVGYQPYTYSDVTGLAAGSVTNPSGRWTQLIDGGSAGFKWDLISHNSTIPDGGDIVTRVRCSDDQNDLENENFVEVENGVSFLCEGQFLEVQTRLTANSESESPVLFDLTAFGSPPNTPPVAQCQDVEIAAPLGSCSIDASIDNGSFDPDGDGVSIVQNPAGPYSVGSTLVELTITEEAPAPGLSDSCSAIVTVVDITPPDVDAGADQTIEATGPDGAAATLSPSATDGCTTATIVDISPDLSVYPIGTTTVTVTGEDEAGNQATDTVDITVVDTTAPTASFEKAGDDELWPPNHQLKHMITITDIADIADPDPDVSIVVTSNQALNGTGDGDTDSDWNLVANADGSYEVWLRSERKGNSSDQGPRTYSVTITITDAHGNQLVEICDFTAPHDQGGGNDDDGDNGGGNGKGKGKG